MRRAVLALSAVALLGAAGCATTVVKPSGSTTHLTTPPSATSSSPALVAPAPPLSFSAAPVSPPTSYSGYDSATISIAKPAGATTVVATISGGTPGRHFGVRALDGAREYLVETDGVYRGSVLLDADGGTTTQLHVFSRGPWAITLSDPRTAPVFNNSDTSGTSGSGDTVFVYDGNGGVATVTGGATGTTFQIRAYGGGELNGQLVSAPGTYGGQIRWPAGTALISVRAVGPWSISMG